MYASDLPALGIWRSGPTEPRFDGDAILAATRQFRSPVHVVREGPRGRLGVAFGGDPLPFDQQNGVPTWPLVATLPGLWPEWLGDRTFCAVHGLRFPYVAGAMANGIATAQMVIAMANAGMLGFFGAAGLPRHRVEAALDEIEAALGRDGASWGANLIHSPNEPSLEESVADLYIRRGVRRVSASAYMALTPAIVRYAATGLHEDEQGRVLRRNHVFAKISRPEVAQRFMAPAPAEILDKLVAQGLLTADEARLARRVPVAEDYTVEADSGGHTDNRPLPALFPIIANLRDRMVREHGYTRPIRVGAAGGLGTPEAVAGAFAMGAAFVLTGSINQSAVESGLSEAGKQMLAQADLADVMMAPAADMFEQGVKVQVLRRGTMFGVRGARLYEAYRAWPSLDAIPADERQRLEREIFRMSLAEVWAETERFWADRDPRELERARREPRHQMALAFRWYLGLASRWAIIGQADRRTDFQVWCGPAMGAFNAWVKGSFLEDPAERTVAMIARNLLEGAASVTRAQQLRACGVAVPQTAFDFRPHPLD